MELWGGAQWQSLPNSMTQHLTVRFLAPLWTFLQTGLSGFENLSAGRETVLLSQVYGPFKIPFRDAAPPLPRGGPLGRLLKFEGGMGDRKKRIPRLERTNGMCFRRNQERKNEKDESEVGLLAGGIQTRGIREKTNES
jgi:hypothetical protein